MTDSMLRGTFEIGKFSGAMRAVEAERTVREVALSQKRGDALAPSARMLMEMEMEFREKNAQWENPMEREKQTKAMKAMVQDEASMWQEFQKRGENMGPLDRIKLWEDMKKERQERLDEIEEYEKTGKMPARYKKSMENYGDSLPGWADNVRKNELAKRGRPDRFGS